MIPASFEYSRPSSVGDALKMLADDSAQALAGGHSLLPAMKLRLNEPGTLVDVGRLEELRFIRRDGDTLVIGASTTHHEIANSSDVADAIPMLAEGADHIGDPAVRNKGTLGGSIAHADPAADWPAMMLAVNATIVMASGKGERRMAAGDFFQGFFMTALEDGELITQVEIPVPSGQYSSAYTKFEQPASRFAIVGCAAMADVSGGTFTDVRVAFSGAADAAFRDSGVEAALEGKPATAETVAAAVEHAANGVDMMEDHYAGAPYRAHLAKVYAKRALHALL
ncbi:MAG: xanthine dehydrogenase family protein subunit M [Bacteroidota bacterium]